MGNKFAEFLDSRSLYACLVVRGTSAKLSDATCKCGGGRLAAVEHAALSLATSHSPAAGCLLSLRLTFLRLCHFELSYKSRGFVLTLNGRKKGDAPQLAH
jgi:hypothetical protein